MKNELTEWKLRASFGLTRHFIGGVLCLAATSLVCSSASAQNLFASGSDARGGKIFEFTPDGVKSTFASGLMGPGALAFDSAGNLFVADIVFNGNTTSGSIYKFTPDGVRSTLAHGLSYPSSLACDSAGNLFVLDGSNVYKFTPSGVQSTFASGMNGALAFDRADNLFVAIGDGGTNYTIYKFAPDGRRATFASGSLGPWDAGSIVGVAFDSKGNFYVAATGFFSYSGGGDAIYKFTPQGERRTLYLQTGFGCPLGPVAIDKTDSLLIADACDGAILEFTPARKSKPLFEPLFEGEFFYLAFQPPQSPTPTLVNISARGSVETGQDALISGFIITGNDSKQVIIRALGPTLTRFGVPDALQDPVLGLLNNTTMMTSNDNWQNAANASQIPMNYRPSDIRESALMTTLPPGAYTTVLTGKNATTGNGLLEVYSSPAGLSNASIRGFVRTGDDVLIGGFSSSGGNGSIQLIIRALGPTLTKFGVNGALGDPTLALIDGNGNRVASNDNWKNTQQSLIQATGFAPPNDLESAILATLPNGNYTAVVSGKNGATGIGLLEIYKVAVASNH